MGIFWENGQTFFISRKRHIFQFLKKYEKLPEEKQTGAFFHFKSPKGVLA